MYPLRETLSSAEFRQAIVAQAFRRQQLVASAAKNPPFVLLHDLYKN
jgi:PTS system ascorbate-specific IIA component